MGALRSLFLLALVLATTLNLLDGVSAAPRRALGKVKGNPPQKPLPPTPFDPKNFPVASNPPSPSGSRKGSMDSTISFDSNAPSVPSIGGSPSRKGSADSSFSFDSKDGGSRRSSVGSVSSVDSAAAAKKFLSNVPNAFEPYSGNSGGSRKGSGATPRILVIKGGPQKPLPPNPSRKSSVDSSAASGFHVANFPVASNPPSPSGSRKGSMDSTISFDSKAPSVPSLNGLLSRKDSVGCCGAVTWAPNRLEGMGSDAVFLWYESAVSSHSCVLCASCRFSLLLLLLVFRWAG
ncbi:unnamed protein product [Closterium sp. Naga37s-1]|nr:unnamed protein product [Closterium sp. Naga37s-1]